MKLACSSIEARKSALGIGLIGSSQGATLVSLIQIGLFRLRAAISDLNSFGARKSPSGSL